MTYAKMHRYRATGPNFLLELRNSLNLTLRQIVLEQNLWGQNRAGQNAKKQFKGLLPIRLACMVISKDWLLAAIPALTMAD
jgi:hypothetical protein